MCVWIYARMFAYSSKRDTPNCPKVGMLICWNQEEILEMFKLLKSALYSSPGGCGFCRLPSKDVIRTERSQSCLFGWYYRNRRHNTQKIVLCSESSEDRLGMSKTKIDGHMTSTWKLFPLERRLQERTLGPRRTVLCSSLWRTAPRPKLLFRRDYYRNKV